MTFSLFMYIYVSSCIEFFLSAFLQNALHTSIHADLLHQVTLPTASQFPSSVCRVSGLGAPAFARCSSEVAIHLDKRDPFRPFITSLSSARSSFRSRSKVLGMECQLIPHATVLRYNDTITYSHGQTHQTVSNTFKHHVSGGENPYIILF